MTTPTADSGVRAAPDAGLRPGVLKVRHAAITSLAVITPAAAINFLWAVAWLRTIAVRRS